MLPQLIDSVTDKPSARLLIQTNNLFLTDTLTLGQLSHEFHPVTPLCLESLTYHHARTTRAVYGARPLRDPSAYSAHQTDSSYRLF